MPDGLIGIVGAPAFLNAVADFCVGCKPYGLLVRRPQARVPGEA